jgi:hypothetical protein
MGRSGNGTTLEAQRAAIKRSLRRYMPYQRTKLENLALDICASLMAREKLAAADPSIGTEEVCRIAASAAKARAEFGRLVRLGQRDHAVAATPVAATPEAPARDVIAAEVAAFMGEGR